MTQTNEDFFETRGGMRLVWHWSDDGRLLTYFMQPVGKYTDAELQAELLARIKEDE